MKSLVWVDPINRDAHFLKLIAEIIYSQTDQFQVVTTQRSEMILNSHIPLRPFFTNIDKVNSGSISILNKLRLLSNYYVSFQNIAHQVGPDTLLLYSSGVSLPELEFLGIQALKKKASKVIMLVHNLEDTHASLPQLSQWRSHHFIKQFDGWVFLSEYMRQKALEKLRLSRERTFVMPHPHFHPMMKDVTVDPSLMTKLKEFAQGRPVMSFISKADLDHGIDYFYQVLHKVQERGLSMCGVVLGRLGKNWNLTKNHSFIQSSGLSDKQLHLQLGTYSYSELMSVLLLSDFVLAPYRSISQSGAVALALGEQVPVVASRAGANAEMIKEKINGLLFDVSDLDSLVDELVLTYKHFPSMRQRFPEKPDFNQHLAPEPAVKNLLYWLQHL